MATVWGEGSTVTGTDEARSAAASRAIAVTSAALGGARVAAGPAAGRMTTGAATGTTQAKRSGWALLASA